MESFDKSPGSYAEHLKNLTLDPGFITQLKFVQYLAYTAQNFIKQKHDEIMILCNNDVHIEKSYQVVCKREATRRMHFMYKR